MASPTPAPSENNSRVQYDVPRPQHAQADWLYIHGLNLDAQGVARQADGKVVFIDGALPTEWISAKMQRSKKQWGTGVMTALHHTSSQRVRPACPYFGLQSPACGGCKMQHLHPRAQVAIKQRVLEDNFRHLAKCSPQQVLRPIYGPDWAYRWRARLSVRYVIKKDAVLIGFRERKSRYVADMHSCAILPAHVSQLLIPLRALIMRLNAREACPQIEVACGENVIALVLRHLEPLSSADIQHLHDFTAQYPTVQWWLQPKGPDTMHCITPHAPQLAYSLPDFGLQFPFKPSDFTQVNPHINRVLVSRALQLLAVQTHERVIDWFCGLGNFTLPLATQARAVLGVEGSAALVQRAQDNRAATPKNAHGKTLAPTQFVTRNLFEMTAEQLIEDGMAEKWLIDPPREGALSLLSALVEAQQSTTPQQAAATHWQPPQRIVYVSCNPATLARDAQLLVHQAGYTLQAAGVVNMFPHTAHVESIAVFERAA